METLYLGIDPGQSGAFALVDKSENVVAYDKFYYIGTELDVRRIALSLNKYQKTHNLVCAFEKVGAMAGQGVCAMFTFGKTTGQLIALLKILKIPFVEVLPTEWKSEVLTGMPWKADTAKFKTDKTKSKEENEKAKEEFKKLNSKVNTAAKKNAKIVSCNYVMKRYPNVQIMNGKNPHDGIGDAICMAVYAKRKL